MIKKNKAPPHKKYNLGGRPTKYRKEFCEKLIDHMAKGLSFETFGTEIGVCKFTIYEWAKEENKHKYPGFSNAKKIAQGECEKYWETMGNLIARGDMKNGNSGVWIYNMKCRFPKVWRPKKEVEVSARYENDIKAIETMSTEQLALLAETAAKYLKEKAKDD